MKKQNCVLIKSTVDNVEVYRVYTDNECFEIINILSENNVCKIKKLVKNIMLSIYRETALSGDFIQFTTGDISVDLVEGESIVEYFDIEFSRDDFLKAISEKSTGRITITVPQFLIDIAKQKKINISKLCTEALRSELFNK